MSVDIKQFRWIVNADFKFKHLQHIDIVVPTQVDKNASRIS